MNYLLEVSLFYTPFVATMVCPGLGFTVTSMFLFYHYTHRLKDRGHKLSTNGSDYKRNEQT